jgi:hypothetical protein
MKPHLLLQRQNVLLHLKYHREVRLCGYQNMRYRTISTRMSLETQMLLVARHFMHPLITTWMCNFT